MAPNKAKILKARACYGHLGGTLGNRLFERLIALNWFEKAEDKATVWTITEKGKTALEQLGVDIYERR